uniref:Uncharacterized protein n=1 Tax=Parascaris univalens TaxID=6257 RepID=A0A915ATD0_PARUN
MSSSQRQPSADRVRHVNTWRCSLPAPMISKDEISIWNVLKHFLGRDLTRVTIPIVFNEPLSFLQRLAEYMEYCELLRMAHQCDDEFERFEVRSSLAPSDLYETQSF